jgi:pyruvate ferredoxin oxidoreductase beta subunit
VQWEIEDGVLRYSGPSRMIAIGRRKRKPIVEYLKRQGRFAHFTEEDIAYFQSQVDEIWEKWGTPGVSQVRLDLKGDKA